MGSAIQKKILDALLMTLRPLARAMLRSGIGYTEFADMAKIAFVNVSAEEFGLRGRQTNTSRIAAMTGISRKEVKRIRDYGPGVLVDQFVRESPASVVLQYWHSDPEYLGADNEPKTLEFDEGDSSFAKLVSTYAGDIPPGAMRSELKRVGAIEEVEGKMLRPKKIAYLPDGVDDRVVIALQEVLAAAADTAAYNCNPDLVEGVDTRFLAVSSVDGVNLEDFPEIKSYARKQLFSLGTGFSNYLSDIKQRNPSEPNPGSQIGIGLFYYELGEGTKR